MYNVGDKIVYPMHGAGIIEEISEKEILGKKTAYYILRVPMGNITLMVPVASADQIGVRYIVGSEVIDLLLIHIRNCEILMNDNWNKRYRENMEIIKKGELFDIAAIYKYLVLREREKGLSSGEKKMLMSAKQIIVSEMILSKDTDRDTAENMLLDEALYNTLSSEEF